MTDAGELFAVPVSAQYTAILYNKKIFRENGIKIPVTWDEFIQVCETLKKKGITPLMFQTKDAWHIHYSFDSFMKGYLGGDAFIKSLQSGTYDFTNPTFVGALKRLKSLRPYFPANFTGLGYSDAQNMMATEQVAMWPGCGSWEVFTLKDINPEVELGVFANPVEKVGDKAYVTVFTDQGIALSAKASEAEKAAATRFMKWLATPKAGLLINKYLGFFNCFDNNVFDDEAMKEYAALAGSHGENIISDWAILLSDGNPTATELIQAGIQELMTDKKSAEEVAADIKKGLSIWYGK
jgi:raffinose/stachyose/melibiose transport system substrate-binding protein